MFPIELVEAVEYLNTLTIAVSENHEDGRVNSIDDEDTIIDLLIEKYGNRVEKPPARCWWDLKLFGYPINIKSSKFGSAADNFSSKAAILYALTNIDEEDVRCTSWKSFQTFVLTSLAPLLVLYWHRKSEGSCSPLEVRRGV